MFSSETYYRRTAAEGATYIGLLVVVYDTLAGDLRQAGEAASRGDIAGRCDATNHALLLLGHLESWAESLDEPVLQDSLRQFYSYVRSQALALQVSAGSEGFGELAHHVAETRAAWQQRETQARQVRLGSLQSGLPSTFADDTEGRERNSWSA